MVGDRAGGNSQTRNKGDRPVNRAANPLHRVGRYETLVSTDQFAK